MEHHRSIGMSFTFLPAEVYKQIAILFVALAVGPLFFTPAVPQDLTGQRLVSIIETVPSSQDHHLPFHDVILLEHSNVIFQRTFWQQPVRFAKQVKYFLRSGSVIKHLAGHGYVFLADNGQVRIVPVASLLSESTSKAPANPVLRL